MKQEGNKREKLHKKKIMALLFLGMMGIIVLINLISRDKEFSDKENRMLEQKPQITLSGIESGRFMDQYEAYKSDQFAGRNLWVALKTRVDLLVGKRESNGVFKGKKHYLLEDIARPNEEQMQQNLETIREFESKYDEIPMYMMLVPNAANILSDKLPNFAVTEDQNEVFEGIQKALGEQITWVDVSKTLAAHKKENIYYRTDHHWTTLGACYAYQQLAETMNLDTSKEPKLTEYAVTSTFNGTLSATSGYETGYEEPIYIYAPKNEDDAPKVVVNYVEEQKKTATLYDSSKLEEKDKYAMFLSGNHATVDIRTTADTTDRLLLIKDSYANCLVPFLTPYYREIIIIDPRYYYGNLDEVMAENKITSVLFLYNGNTFVEDNSISGVLQNGETE
ncbi:DHHW family protein [Bariatricus sp. SGI.154]|uniref:DHHW family protein n=1 Tax=Bariatricus sp. SGI.154 TaxID=3420549 RepID=UPI003CFEF3E7